MRRTLARSRWVSAFIRACAWTQRAEMQETRGINREWWRGNLRPQLSLWRIDLNVLAIDADDANAGGQAFDHDEDSIAAIDDYPGGLTKATETFLPLTRRAETMNAAIRAVADEDPSATIERQIVRRPIIRQLSTRGRAPVAAQYEAVQRNDTQAVIVGIANKEVAAADGDAVRILQLSRATANATGARH